jgi:hypothetical protein
MAPTNQVEQIPAGKITRVWAYGRPKEKAVAFCGLTVVSRMIGKGRIVGQSGRCLLNKTLRHLAKLGGGHQGLIPINDVVSATTMISF